MVRKWNIRVKLSDVKLFSLTARSVCGLLKYSRRLVKLSVTANWEAVIWNKSSASVVK